MALAWDSRAADSGAQRAEVATATAAEAEAACGGAAADTVRVKAMNARLEEDVSVSDLPAYLLNALHPHGSAGVPPGGRTPHAGGARGADDGAEDGDEPSAHGGRERQRRAGRR